MPKCKLVALTTPHPGREAEFHDWYQNVHLPEILSLPGGVSAQRYQLVAKLNHKISGPLSAVLMPLLGSVAAFGLARSGKLFIRAVAGLALGFAFFVADNFAMAMADFGTYPPWAAAWAPFLLFLLVGESVLFRTEE